MVNSTCFFSISVLLLVWIATIIAFLFYLRRQRHNVRDLQFGESSDVLLGLFSQKAREARVAAERLSKVADELGIGIIEKMPGQGLSANEWAKRFLPREATNEESFEKLMEQEAFPCTVQKGERIIEIRKLEAASRLILLLQDVTEGYKLARELKQKERLALLGQMSAQVAHQIKTPLSVLAGRAQMLARRLSPNSRERNQAEALFLEARELAGQVTQIVNFYKEMEPEYSSVFVNDVLEDTARRLGSMMASCKIVVDCPSRIELRTDRRLLSDALFLVAQNSLSSESQADLIELKARKGEGIVKIILTDNGKGFEIEDLDKIFEPFFTTREEGLGLGLFMARDILSRIDCKIKALKGEKQGAKFEILIPVGKEEGPRLEDKP